MKINKGWIILITVIVVIILLISWGVRSYNNLVANQENVNQAWAQVENVYQRRADLIPNLVSTVKGVANFERQTLTDVIEARSKATQVKISPEKLDEASIQKFQAAQDDLSSALARLMVVVENYPQLKATQNFLELQSQLEGTENRITVERMKFNQVAQAYNTLVRKFPSSIFAGIFGFEKKGYFVAQDGAEKAPEVQF